MKRAPRALLAAAVVSPLAFLTLHSICDFYFDCGCEPIWAGGLDHCNIHGPPPHCPWCSGGNGRAAWIGAMLLGGIGLGSTLGARRTLPEAIGLGFAGFVVASRLAAWIAAAL